MIAWRWQLSAHGLWDTEGVIHHNTHDHNLPTKLLAGIRASDTLPLVAFPYPIPMSQLQTSPDPQTSDENAEKLSVTNAESALPPRVSTVPDGGFQAWATVFGA